MSREVCVCFLPRVDDGAFVVFPVRIVVRTIFIYPSGRVCWASSAGSDEEEKDSERWGAARARQSADDGDEWWNDDDDMESVCWAE